MNERPKIQLFIVALLVWFFCAALPPAVVFAKAFPVYTTTIALDVVVLALLTAAALPWKRMTDVRRLLLVIVGCAALWTVVAGIPGAWAFSYFVGDFFEVGHSGVPIVFFWVLAQSLAGATYGLVRLLMPVREATGRPRAVRLAVTASAPVLLFYAIAFPTADYVAGDAPMVALGALVLIVPTLVIAACIAMVDATRIRAEATTPSGRS